MTLYNQRERQIGRDSLRRDCPLCNSSRISNYRQIPRNYAGASLQLFLGKCARCSFVFALNDPHIEYDEQYLNLEQVTTAGDVLAHFRAQERIANIAQFLPPAPERSFLDIGIGDGLLLSVAETSGYSTFGLDVSPVGVEMARERYSLRADVRFDPLERAFPGQLFDVIHMNEVIEHISDPMALLRWCRTHLNRSGYLIVQTGNINSLASRIKGADWDYFRPVHVSYFSTRTLSRALLQSGFTILRRGAIDWRLKPSLKAGSYLWKHEGPIRALRFLWLFLTAIPHGIRRSVLIYATAG